MIIVDHHSSVVLITDSAQKRFVFSGYDLGYPVSTFHGAAQLFGGNTDSTDESPRDTICRELKEELDSQIVGKEYAPKKDIDTLLQQILNSLQPHQDCLIQDPALRVLNPGRKLESLVSCYIARVSTSLLDMVENYLGQGLKFVSEGEMHYASIDDLLKGKPLLAWCVPAIVGQILQVKLHNPFCAQAIPIGPVRNSFKEYKEFGYVVGVKKDETDVVSEHTL